MYLLGIVEPLCNLQFNLIVWKILEGNRLFRPLFQDPTFNESFKFEVDDSHAYLNACVWCRIPEKLDKQSRVIKPEKDIPLGHVSTT